MNEYKIQKICYRLSRNQIRISKIKLINIAISSFAKEKKEPIDVPLFLALCGETDDRF